MSKFENELKKGNFVISKCQKCKKVVWPVNDICDNCFSKVVWISGSISARIIEYSKQKNNWFCLVETNDQIRMLGTLKSDNEPKIEQKILLDDCFFDKKPHFIFKSI